MPSTLNLVSSATDVVTLPGFFDAHIHLRDGEFADRLAFYVWYSGVDTCLVMPNTNPKIFRAVEALKYKEQLELASGKNVNFLMSLYLHNETSVDRLTVANEYGVKNIKLYPNGVTTGSDSGIVDLESFYPIFRKMAELGMILNIHCEMPTSGSTWIINAETMFIPKLEAIIENCPGLKIIVEHVSSRAMIEFVKTCPANVAATVTIHHLEIILDDCVQYTPNLCKPIPKGPEDLYAIREVVFSEDPHFFFGSDSAPHKLKDKRSLQPPCGVFSGAHTASHLVRIFAQAGKLDILPGFISTRGRKFYGLPETQNQIQLIRTSEYIPEMILGCIPYRAEQPMEWKINSFSAT